MATVEIGDFQFQSYVKPVAGFVFRVCVLMPQLVGSVYRIQGCGTACMCLTACGMYEVGFNVLLCSVFAY